MTELTGLPPEEKVRINMVVQARIKDTWIRLANKNGMTMTSWFVHMLLVFADNEGITRDEE